MHVLLSTDVANFDVTGALNPLVQYLGDLREWVYPTEDEEDADRQISTDQGE